MRHLLLVPIMAMIVSGCSQNSSDSIVPEKISATLEIAKPGDTVRIKSGEYEDVQLDLYGEGDVGMPIVICPEVPGSVTLSGASSLNVSGRHLIISGLHFDNGYSDGSVITFRSHDGKSLAQNVRITSCAVSNYSNPDRIHSDHWIQLFGRENRFDHNYIGTKWNLGATMVVRLGDSLSTNNLNSIDSNYFGPKPRLGSNGGETLRIGSSANSLKKGGASVVSNYFDRCSGEVEVLSIKSSDNLISDNVFYECEGVLALRHGNNNIVSNNLFIGNNKPETGGLRVINAGHRIENNLFYGVTGKRFFAALAVMNGVPNSAINRYHQVSDVQIRSNTWIDCERISFGVGADNERTAQPIRTSFESNSVFYSDTELRPFFFSDSEGISFSSNQTNVSIGMPGFNIMDYATMAQPNIDSIRLLARNMGPSWLNASELNPEVSKSNRKEVVSPTNFHEIMDNLKGGDTILFSPNKIYTLSKPIVLRSDIVLMTEGSGYAVIQPGEGFKGALFEIVDGVSVSMHSLWLKGRNQVHNAPYGIEAKAPMLEHYKLFIDSCRFSDFKESRYAAIHAEKGTFADTVVVKNSWFKDFSGYGIALNTENDDRGRYNAEYITIENSKFVDMMGTAIDIYRGGNDESTLGPFVTITNCDFLNVCNRELGTAVRMIGVQWSEIDRCRFVESGKSGRSIWFEDPAWADIKIRNIQLSNSGKIQTFYPHRVERNTIRYDELFLDRSQLEKWMLN